MNFDAGNVGDIRTQGWDFFDRIYCISVDERKDRRESVRAQFSRVVLNGKVEFFIVRRHPSNIEQGIYESHMACLRKGLEAGAERIAVFEDDVVFDRFDPDRLCQCTRFLSARPWNVLLFGALIGSSRKTAEAAVQEVEYASLAHGYALNRPYAETLAYEPWRPGIASDTLFRPPTDRVYAASPMFAFQSNSSSDNEKYLRLDHFRRMCGGLERIQKANEFYHRHKFGIIAGHCLVILMLLMLCLYC